WLLIPAEMAAREIYAQLSTPLTWRFLQEMPERGDEWAAATIASLGEHCGATLDGLWKITLTDREAPALMTWLNSGTARLGDLMHCPHDRDQRISAVPLLLLRGDESTLGPADDTTLAA